MQEKNPHRKQIRLKGYDYSSEGYYFITICTQNRKNILANVVGVAPLGDPQTINTKPNANVVGADSIYAHKKKQQQKERS